MRRLELIFSAALAACGASSTPEPVTPLGAAVAPVAAPAAVSAPSSDAGAASQITVGSSDNSVEVAAGGTFVVELESNRTTPYAWQVMISDPSIVTQLSDEYVPPDPSKCPGCVGVPGTERFTFRGLTAGSAQLHLEYRHVGNATQAPGALRDLQVNVH